MQRYATRLNSFASDAARYWSISDSKPTVLQMVERAATVAGLTDLDLNYPDHTKPNLATIGHAVNDGGLSVSGMAIRYYSLPAFKAGAFTNPDKSVRQSAIDITKEAIDAGRELGARLLTIWPGQDGYETHFQADYTQLWDHMLQGLAAVSDHDPDCDISLEYKPDEPRARALLPDCSTTLLMLSELNRSNTGVTLDFAHSLYAGETPAFAAALIVRNSRLLGLHLNDGYGRRDDGLMVAAVNPQATLELLIEARRANFDGPIYFDTFPNTADLDPVAECEANIAMTNRLLSAAERMEGGNKLREALDRQDPVEGLTAAHEALFRD